MTSHIVSKEQIEKLREELERGESYADNYGAGDTVRQGFHEALSILTAIEQQPVQQEPVIPEGWQLVPKEPTRKMIDDGYHAACNSPFSKSADCYRAALAAAPAYTTKDGSNGK